MTTSLLRLPTIPPLFAPEPASRSCTMPLRRLREGRLVDGEDLVAVEAELRVRVQNGPDAILSRTPGDDLNLVVGHLFCAGLIEGPGEVERIGFSCRAPSRADVILHGSPVIRPVPELPAARIEPEGLFRLKEVFERRQNLFRNTGSTHAAALFSLDGRLFSFGEDVGRHNAFDKAVGRALLEGTLGRAAIAMLSSRIAAEMAGKAARAGIPVLCGFSAATTSGVAVALERGITLVGRLRGRSFDVYANAWRLTEA
ncbi:formate dehydrogenase accessory sulfurtransferase FdhD [Desulfovibrio sp. Huiquan2017]|uniref:formate dehydrogenase accessory sulfurtransferase FdhD n=1 Tax=Desulfovibrio sp. Huiquan2017 TaxID=2816861 RepID=UPI001A91EC91|nr:formate dehydrogenase accessory sulfurtransferase FdhD [Desulfovibrio sp. Huiquan2017]